MTDKNLFCEKIDEAVAKSGKSLEEIARGIGVVKNGERVSFRQSDSFFWDVRKAEVNVKFSCR